MGTVSLGGHSGQGLPALPHDTPGVLANSSVESAEGRGSEVAWPPNGCCRRSPHTSGRQRGPHTHPLGCASHCRAGHCGQPLDIPQLDKGAPCPWATRWHCSGDTFFGGTPAWPECGADGPRLLDPGLPAPRLGQHLQPAGLRAPAHNRPAAAPTSHLLWCRPLCPSECTAN